MSSELKDVHEVSSEYSVGYPFYRELPLIPANVFMRELRDVMEALKRSDRIIVYGKEFSGKRSLLQQVTNELIKRKLKILFVSSTDKDWTSKLKVGLRDETVTHVILDRINIFSLSDELINALKSTQKKLIISVESDPELWDNMLGKTERIEMLGRINSWQLLEVFFRRTYLSIDRDLSERPSRRLLRELWYFTGGWLREIYLILKVSLDMGSEDQKPKFDQFFISELRRVIEPLTSHDVRLHTHESERSALNLLESLSVPDSMPTWEELYQKYSTLETYPRLISRVLWRVPEPTRKVHAILKKVFLPKLKTFGLKPESVFVYQSWEPMLPKFAELSRTETGEAWLSFEHFILSTLFPKGLTLVELTLDREGQRYFVQVILETPKARFREGKLTAYLKRYIHDMSSALEGYEIVGLDTVLIPQGIYKLLRDRNYIIDLTLQALKSGEIDRAIELTALSLSSVDPILANVNLGFIYLLKCSWDRALRAVERATKLSKGKRSSTAMITKGYALAQLGRYDEAMEAYREALELFTEAQENVLMHKVLIYVPIKSDIDPFWDVIESPKVDLLIQTSMATLYSLQGKHEEAINLIESIMEPNQNEQMVLRVASFIYARAGRNWQELHDKLRSTGLESEVLQIDSKLIERIIRS